MRDWHEKGNPQAPTPVDYVVDVQVRGRSAHHARGGAFAIVRESTYVLSARGGEVPSALGAWLAPQGVTSFPLNRVAFREPAQRGWEGDGVQAAPFAVLFAACRWPIGGIALGPATGRDGGRAVKPLPFCLSHEPPILTAAER